MSSVINTQRDAPPAWLSGKSVGVAALCAAFTLAPQTGVADGITIDGGLEMGFTSTNPADRRATTRPHVGFNAEIEASTQLDNGVTVGLRIHLEEDLDPADGSWSIRISDE